MRQWRGPMLGLSVVCAGLHFQILEENLIFLSFIFAQIWGLMVPIFNIFNNLGEFVLISTNLKFQLACLVQTQLVQCHYRLWEDSGTDLGGLLEGLKGRGAKGG